MRSDVRWPDGREICINWNKRHCADDKACGRVHACLICKRTNHNEQRCFKKSNSKRTGLNNSSKTEKAHTQ
ncbi:hypothetical protein C2G38_2059770 [Gigaspora rosea]|uniref:C3H1-type domain-containing protein n=1 Tax=Gigaspora rosea TaxID=44941 RepID=A0A397W2E7_9GLOM|nr:hypothetical protein C2G38_2059770 [Gigaspora rosea]